MNVYQKPDKKRYKTKFRVCKEDWEKLNNPKLKDERLKELKRKLNALKESAEKVIEKLEFFSFLTFEEVFFKKIQNATDTTLSSKKLADWFNYTISELKKNEQIGTASSYQTTINSIEEFKKGLQLQDITGEFLKSYEEFILEKGNNATTVGIYMRNLRAIINNAIRGKLIKEENYPFKNYRIPSGQNVKKALKDHDVNRLLNLSPVRNDHKKALAFWMFSYVCNGMNFADIIALKHENVSGDFIQFRRQKTIRTKKKDPRPIKVGLNAKAKAIIETYKNIDKDNPYLFPVLEDGLAAKTRKYRCQRFIKWVNARMYEICKEIGIEHKTSTYAARHTFSTVLKRKGVPISYIKDALGHSSVATTENYLDSFEDETTLLYADSLLSFT